MNYVAVPQRPRNVPARAVMPPNDSIREETVRAKKIQRLKNGFRPRTLDLFAGCGGLSLGFHSAGFETVGAVEFDQLAAASHAANFFKFSPEEIRAEHAKPRDIITTDPLTLLEDLHAGQMDTAIDVVIGGPPCQAFARVGRAKLREVADHPEAFLNDPRGNLYLRYLHYVRELQPLAILMENVPDVLNYGGHNIADETCELLTAWGYRCKYTLLNSVYYGVPEMRERMFLVAYAEQLGSNVTFPDPTHWIDLPQGYHGSRQVALKTVGASLFQKNSFYTPAPVARKSLRPAVTAEEALRDLPTITKHLVGQMPRGKRSFDELVAYRGDVELSSYGKLMREWPGFENRLGVCDHVIRSLPRDYAIFHRMNPGDQYPEAYEHALVLFREKVEAIRASGKSFKEGTVAYEALKKATVPGYDPTKFPNKWRKMEPDRPARTLMAHLGKDSYSHIHYDSTQARTISVREAARLQSFPDGFIFCGSMNPAFRQIGNAVPPLLAHAIAVEIMSGLGLQPSASLQERL